MLEEEMKASQGRLELVDMDSDLQGAELFSKSLERLQQIVQRLEKGDLSLEESIRLHREGKICVRYCRQCLALARNELEDEAGNVELADDFLARS